MTEEIVRYVVSRAVWAPSVHNTQPWRFAADGGPQISLHADVERRLAIADPDGREMMISCGAALFTIRLALRSLGYIPETRVLPDPAQPDLVAQVAWHERADADEFERRLAGHVLTRRTHRGAFDPEPLPPDTLAALRDAAAREGSALRIMADDGRRATLAAAVQSAEYQLRQDGERLRELARWTPAPGSARHGGIPRLPPTRRGPSTPSRSFPGAISPADTAGGCRRSAWPRRTGPRAWPGCSPRPPTARWTGCTPGRRCSGSC